MVYMLESFGLSELGTEHKMILDALRKSKNCIGITSKTRTLGMEPTILLLKPPFYFTRSNLKQGFYKSRTYEKDFITSS